MPFAALPAHPLAELFPMMEEPDVARLADDICTNGQREPIVLLDGRVLDGRNRQAACIFADIEPAYRDFDPAREGDPLAFIVSANLHRRHLNESQRAMVAAKLATWTGGTNQHTASRADLPVWKAAALVNVSPRIVRSAKRVLEKGVPALCEAVSRGDVRVRRAEVIAKHGAIEQAALLRNHGERDGTTDDIFSVTVAGRTLRSLDLVGLRIALARIERESDIARAILRHAGAANPSSMIADVVSMRWLSALLRRPEK